MSVETKKPNSRRGAQLSVYIEPRLKRWLRAHAQMTGQRLHFVVGQAIAEYREKRRHA